MHTLIQLCALCNYKKEVAPRTVCLLIGCEWHERVPRLLRLPAPGHELLRNTSSRARSHNFPLIKRAIRCAILLAAAKSAFKLELYANEAR